MRMQLKQNDKTRLLIVSGPTASGKSALGVQLALELGGEIISADSMQVYRGMDIGTAKITETEMKGIPHHMIDVADPGENFNISRYTNAARACIEDIASRGMLPIVVGGTGFYIHALVYDTVFEPECDEDKTVRSRLEAEAAEMGSMYMWEKLRRADPAYAESIHPNNKKRVIRALEYHILTGQKLSEHNSLQKAKPSPYDFIYLAINKDRAQLYSDIDRRVDMMMEQGLEDEVRALYQSGCRSGMVSMQAIGYKELAEYIEGKCPLPEAVENIRRESRRYAKRQLTWLRHEKDVRWLNGPNQTEALDIITKEWTETIKS